MPDLAGGGAERVMLNLAAGIAGRGLPVDLVVTAVRGAYADQIPPGVRFVDLGAPRTGLSLLALRRYVRSSGTPAIVSALHHGNLAALLALRPLRLPVRVIPTIHNTLSVQRLRASSSWIRIQHLAIGTCYRWAERIVAVSDDVAEDFHATTGIPRERIETVYNPVVTPDLHERAMQPVDHPWLASGAPPVILGIGRLTAQKDFPTLLRAYALLGDDVGARLMILGEGDQRAALERLAGELGLADRVAFPGFVPNPYAYLARADAFVLSSQWEGLPTVLIEALALGVRLVSTDCRSGPREILRGGRYGRLVPVGDAAAMSAAIAGALGAPKPSVPPEAWERYTLAAAVDGYLRVAGARADE